MTNVIKNSVKHDNCCSWDPFCLTISTAIIALHPTCITFI